MMQDYFNLIQNLEAVYFMPPDNACSSYVYNCLKIIVVR